MQHGFGLTSLSVVIMASCFVGCATLAPEREPEFVGAAQLQGISAAKEGLALLGQSRFIDAELKFLEVLEQQPLQHNILVALGAAQVGSGNFEGALETVAELNRKNPVDLAVVKVVTQALFGLGRDKEAVAVIDRALQIALDKQDVVAAQLYSQMLADQYFRLGFEEAGSCYSSLALQLGASELQQQAAARTWLARGYADKAAGVIGVSVTATEDRLLGKDPARLALQALVAAGIENYADAAKYALRGWEEGSGLSGGQQLELQLVRAFSQSLAPRTGETQVTAENDATPQKQRLITVTDAQSDEAQSENSEGEKGLEITSGQLQSVKTLHWPLVLLELLKRVEKAGELEV